MPMSKHNKNTTDLSILFGGIGLIFFIFFLINSFSVNLYYSKKYGISNASTRVSDSGNILRFSPYIFSFSVLIGMAFYLLYNAHGFMVIIALLMFISGFVGMFLISARIGTSQIGILIYKKQGLFIIPADPNKNTLFQNIFHLQLFKNFFMMEKLYLKDIYKITRESGRKAFIHGLFGTRQVVWRNKQKRDECIAALEMACEKKLSSFDSGK